MTEVLRCGCKVEDGKFIRCTRCEKCTECNLVEQLHPFGERRVESYNLTAQDTRN